MKTIKEISGQKPVFLHEFEEGGAEIVLHYFDVEPPETVKVLFGYYKDENYEGEAFVLFEDSGELYEVNGSHCSCYGLEGQWEAEKVDLDALAHRLINGRLGQGYHRENEFREELMNFIGLEEGEAP